MVAPSSDRNGGGWFLSVKWKAFASSSLIVAGGFILFSLFNAWQLESQYHTSREEVFQFQQRQLNSLLQTQFLRLQQILSGVGSNSGFRSAMEAADADAVSSLIEEQFFSLSLEAGIETLAIFDDKARQVALTGRPEALSQLVEQAMLQEQPVRQVVCQMDHCVLQSVIPILAGEQIVLVAATASPASLWYEFNQVTGSDVALLLNTAGRAEDRLEKWDRTLIAATNRAQTLETLRIAERRWFLSTLSQTARQLESADRDVEVRALGWNGAEVLIVDDVSLRQQRLASAIRQNVLLALLGVVLAGIILLWTLWRPTSRVRRIAQELPRLARGEFQQLDTMLDALGENRVVRDETDLLVQTSRQLSAQLASMQSELRTRNRQLEERGAEVLGERDFVQQLLNATPAFIAMQDGAGLIKLVNHHGARMSGYPIEVLQGRSLVDFIAAGERDGFAERMNILAKGEGETIAHEATFVRAGGEELWFAWHHSVLYDRRRQNLALLSVAIDITERRRIEREMAWLANHDSLTGLFNRHRFAQELQHVIEQNRRHQQPCGMLFFDLDQFKDVNDTSGHPLGDQLLRRIGAALLATARDSDFVARVGGDEFAIIATGLPPDDLPIMAERFCRALSQVSVQGRHHSHRCTASVGAVIIPWHGESVEELLSNADLALYRAKQAGRNQWKIYDPAEDTLEQVHERVYWNEIVSEVLREGRFEMHLQPIQHLQSGTVAHYEALLRVRDAQGNFLATGLFIQAAERNGSIARLDEMIVERVIRHQAELASQGHELSVAVNLSGVSFQNGERLLAHIRAVIERHPVRTGGIIFELTETAAVSDLGLTRQLMSDLKQLGFRFALDDFGVGFSSLYYLRQLPVDYIKIDGSFIRHLCEEPDDQALVRAMVQVARIYKLQTVAEFVETAQIAAMLQDFEVDFAQGWHIGKPIPVEEVAAGRDAMRPR